MDTQRFDNLAVSVATGASRRRLLTGFGALAIGALLGQSTEAKSSGNKGNSGSNSNADCSAGCAHTAKDARKACQDKKNKATKKECLKKVKVAQAECRAACVPTAAAATQPIAETGSAPAPETSTAPDAETGTETDSGIGILAKPLCTTDADCEATLTPNNCLRATCVKQNNRARCEYAREPWLCPSQYCCPYRADPYTNATYPTSGQCVADEAVCMQRPYPSNP